PAFVQTTWFYALCVAGVALCIGAAWQIRVLQLRQRLAIVVEERTRIGRELHDTLLQSLAGLAWQFEDLSREIDLDPEIAKEHVETLRGQVRVDLREVRQSVWDLRSPALESNTLETALQQAGSRIARNRKPRFEFDVHGTPHRFDAKTEEQLLRIAQEALTN